jgi:hypothetical protein
VTRFGEFFDNWEIVYFGQFFITEVATYSNGNFDGFGLILADVFTNSSVHPILNT